MDSSSQRLYVPPAGDDAPLDEIEKVLVRALVSAIVKELRTPTLTDQPEQVIPIVMTARRRA
jgi:hypothetical protein